MRFDLEHGLASVTLDRPDASNTIDHALARELLAVTETILGRDDVRAVLLAGEGDRFCAGGDLAEFAAEDDLAGHLRAVTEALHPAIANLTALDAPVVAAVQGSAAGAGLGLVAAADLVVAGESAKFVMAYTGVGLTPDGSSSWFLPRLVGHRRALELTLTNRVLDAAQALDWGIVTRVVPDDDVRASARELAERLAVGPTKAFGAAKRLLAESWTRPLDEQLVAETDVLATAGATEDARTGLDAFLGKRSPTFGGS